MTDRRKPFLRSPPFPWVDAAVAAVTAGARSAPADPSGAYDAILAELARARVGGTFWSLAAAATDEPCLIVHPGEADDPARMIAFARECRRPGERLLCVAPTERHPDAATQAATDIRWIADAIDPWSILRATSRLIAADGDEWLLVASLAGADLPGSPAPDVEAALLGPAYRNPFTDTPATLAETVQRLALWRQVLDANRAIAVAAGMAWWKREAIERLLWTDRGGRPLAFVEAEEDAVGAAARAHGGIAAWPSRVPDGFVRDAAARSVPLAMVEDGFVRSVGLGVHLHPPLSIVVDFRGIHYDPARASDLETILATACFPDALIQRTRSLVDTIVTNGISKYGRMDRQPGPVRRHHRTILVPGQVEDDLSVLQGGGGVASNLDLLRRARALEPDAVILFKPHPDVDAGHRQGRVPDAELLRHADEVVRAEPMPALLARVDAVHVLTSLTGFEALLRGLEVVTHGCPFYAGWGLTRDLAGPYPRRDRRLTLLELAAGTLILYPRYLDPKTLLPCPPEVLLDRFSSGQTPRSGWLIRARRWQGRVAKLFGRIAR